jgi:hypothetical protein
MSVICRSKPPSLSPSSLWELGDEAALAGVGPGVGDGKGVSVGNIPPLAPRVAAMIVAGNGVEDVVSKV